MGQQAEARPLNVEMSVLSVTFTLSRVDLFNFSLLMLISRRALVKRVLLQLVFALFALLCLQLISEGFRQSSPLSRLGTLVAAQAVFLMLTLLLDLTGLTLYVLRVKKGAVLTEHTITLTDEALVEETMYNRTEWKWLGMTKAQRFGPYLFLFTIDGSAHVIPRRAFLDSDDWDDFYKFCVKKIPVAA